MTAQTMALITGALACGYLIAGLFFLRFWTQTRDDLFLAFSVAFALMALGQALPVILGLAREDQAPVYLIRLAAFAVIIVAVIRKNLRRDV